MIRRASVSTLFFFTLGLFGGSPSGAQQYPLLVPTAKVTVQGSTEAIGNDTPCDASGNIYLSTPAAGPRLEIPRSPGLKISPAGKIVARFDLGSALASELKDAPEPRAAALAADERGNVFVVMETKIHDAYVVRFSADGKYDETIHLDVREINPRQLAVFPTGELLVSGFVQRHEGQKRFPVPYAAIFDRYGKSPLEVKLPGDAYTEDRSEFPPGSEGTKQLYQKRYAMEGVVLNGSVATGWDGNAYLVRGGHPGIVYVLSAHGELVREMKLEPPNPRLDAVMESLSRGQLVVGYGTAPSGLGVVVDFPRLFSVYDALTGERLYDYEQSPDLDGRFACYTGNDFVFLGTDDKTGALTIIRARPK